MGQRKRETALLLAGFLLLAACTAPAARPSALKPTPTPEVTVTPTPEPTPMPTPEPTPTPEEIKELWGFLIDDTHDAFEVPTGGKLGTVLVTVEVGEEEFYFSVWADGNLDEPIQTMTAEGPERLRSYHLMDANFDGYTDFCYSYALAAANARYEVWVWNEEQGQFVGTGQLVGMGLTTDEETQSLFHWVHDSAASGWWEYYCWEDGKLICFRKEEITYPDENFNQEKVVYERIEGELVEISREPYEMKG